MMKTLLRRRLMVGSGDEAATDQQEPGTSTSTMSPAEMASPSSGQHCRACGRMVVMPLPFGRQQPTSQRNSATECECNITLCDACKKFYCRYRAKIQEETCTCGGTMSSPNDKCRLCRFQRCEAAIADKRAMSAPKLAPVERQEAEQLLEKVDFAKLPCSICGYSSSGFHFGVVSCEGCKGFFRRSMNKSYKIQYTCKGITDPTDTSGKKLCPSNSNCRKCRLERCLDAGMSLTEIAIGRHTVRRRAEIDATIKRHFAQGSFLQGKVCRRKRNENGDDKTAPDDELTTSPEMLSSPCGDPGTQQKMMVQMPNSNKQIRTKDEEIGEEKDAKVAMDEGEESSLSTTSHVLTTRAECVSPTAPSLAAHEEISRYVDAHERGGTTSSSAVVSPTGQTPTITASTPLTPNTLASRFNVIANSSLDKSIQESSEWLIERAVEASARLSTISTEKVVFTYEMTSEQMIAERVRGLDVYVKCVSEYVTALPGINQISVPDRIILFTQGFFPIIFAQLSLTFDVEQQIPNHLSLDREGPAWEICAKELAPYHFIVERYLVDAGNKFVTAVGNLHEFSLFCALLLLNPDTPKLENVDGVRMLRRRYELALLHYFSKSSGVRSEQRLGEIYQLLPFFRRSTALYHDVLTEIAIKRPQDMLNWSPLFLQFHSQIVNLPSPGTTPDNKTSTPTFGSTPPMNNNSNY